MNDNFLKKFPYKPELLKAIELQGAKLKKDFHIHTKYCNHAVGEMSEYVESAIARGLDAMGFLEHYEVGINYYKKNWLTYDELSIYYEQGLKLREQFGAQIKIYLGVELGINLTQIEALKKGLEKHPWDHVGLSFHYLQFEPYNINVCSGSANNLKQMANYGLQKAVQVYFDTLQAGIQAIEADFLCHFDVLWRNYPDIEVTPEIEKRIEGILELVRRKKMALEINTSGFLHRGQQYPATWILVRAHQLGIPFVVGSDSHAPDQIARYFDKVEPLIESLTIQK